MSIGRCSLCPQNEDGRYCNQPVPSCGPQPCPVLLIGAGPSKGENRHGEPYIGLAGDELTNTYLPIAGLRREDVHLANASQCWDGSDRTPSEKRVLTCARHHLPALLDLVRPSVVVLLGGVTQRLSDTRWRLDIVHGIPQRTSLLEGTWEGWVYPMFEPALGMRDTSQMTHLMDDFRRLGQWMRGEWEPPVLVEQRTDYQEITESDELLDYLDMAGDEWRAPPTRFNIALDGEDHGPKDHGNNLWSLQISHTPGTGRLIRASNFGVMHQLAQFARESSTTWIMHEAVGDMGRCHQVGIELREWRDTMQEAYHQGNLPQGLKALVYRLFGHRMQSWEDVVWPASVDAWVDWCENAVSLAATQPEPVITEMKRGHCADCSHYHSKGACKCGCPVMRLTRQKTEYRPSALEATLRHLHRYTVQTRDDEEPYNPWKELPAKMVEGLRGRLADKDTWEWVEREVGPPPVLGIGNAELATAIHYGCADADWTLQLADRLEEERRGKQWKVDEVDYDR